MHVFEMVVLIVLIGAVVSMSTAFMERKGSKSDWLNELMDEDGSGNYKFASIDRLVQLEERVAVLERIITDKNYDLKQEIDRL